jgi:hypothetical protein
VAVRDHRFVILPACRLHSGYERGLLWVDTREGTVIGVVTHYFFNDDELSGDHAVLPIYSKQVDASSLPAVSLQDLDTWTKQQRLKDGVRRFVGHREQFRSPDRGVPRVNARRHMLH